MREPVQTEQVAFRAPPVILAKAQERARSEGMSISEYLRDLVRRDLREAA